MTFKESIKTIITEEDEIAPEILQQGKDIAKKLGVRFNGWWEDFKAFLFTDDKDTGSSFLGKDEQDARKNLADLKARYDKQGSRTEMNGYYAMI